MKRLPIIIAAACAAAAAALVASCGDDGSPTTPTPPDTTPPMIVSVTALDRNHVRVDFDEDISKASAERLQNYMIDLQPSSAPGPTPSTGRATAQPLALASAVLTAGKAVTVTTFDVMTTSSYTISVTGVRDLAGNEITVPAQAQFVGMDTEDTTPPEIAFRSPPDGGFEVGPSQSVVVQFNEPMDVGSIYPAFRWSAVSGDVPVRMSVRSTYEFVFSPLISLKLDESYNVEISSLAKDQAGNALEREVWIFRTTPIADGIPPMFASSNPADGAVGIDVTTNIVLVFTEAIDLAAVQQEDGAGILVSPNPGDGILSLSAGGTRLLFEPDNPLQESTQYTILIPEGGVKDLAGNPMEQTVSVRFTTAGALATGSYSGTIAGDPNSTSASDPEGTVAVAPTRSLFGDGDDDAPINGVSIAATGGAYTIDHLPGGWYFPFGIMNSNADGVIDPGAGDAVGIYGVDWDLDLDPDSILVQGGNPVNSVDFELYDPHAISGTVFYTGSSFVDTLDQVGYRVVAFDTTGFDPIGGLTNPDYNIGVGRVPFQPHYTLSFFTAGLEPGTYFIAAFLDLNENQTWEPALEPGAFFEINDETFPVTVENGDDAFNINIRMQDPGSPGPAVASGTLWRTPAATAERVRRLRQLRDFIDEAVRAAGRQ